MSTTQDEFLQSYDANRFVRPNSSVDVVIFTVINGTLQVLLVQRPQHPFKDCWALVGGFVDTAQDSMLEDTAKRKLVAKTGVQTPYLEQYATIGNNTRDPRGWSITTVYFALLPPQHTLQSAAWFPITDNAVAVPLAFDHAILLAGCLARLRQKVLYTALPVHLMGETFTLSDLQKVYELIVGKPLEAKSFRRRLLGADILCATDATRHEGGGRPAQLYRLKPDHTTHFFVRTLEGSA